MLPMHVFLVGMSASGKTSLGRRVASNLGLRFIDTDQRVEEMLGMSIGQIYASLGEDFYHNAETGVLIELVGGGTLHRFHRQRASNDQGKCAADAKPRRHHPCGPPAGPDPGRDQD